MNCVHGIQSCNSCLDKIARDQNAMIRHNELLTQSLVSWQRAIGDYAERSDYYKGLLWEIGSILGEEAYTSDDGTINEDPLVTKIPELIRTLVEKVKRNETMANVGQTKRKK